MEFYFHFFHKDLTVEEMLAVMRGGSQENAHVESGSRARRDEEQDMEKQAQAERRRIVDAINNANSPPKSTSSKTRWAVSVLEGVGLPLNKRGLRELQKCAHPDKWAVADRVDAHHAFQRLSHVEEGLRNGGYL